MVSYISELRHVYLFLEELKTVESPAPLTDRNSRAKIRFYVLKLKRYKFYGSL